MDKTVHVTAVSNVLIPAINHPATAAARTAIRGPGVISVSLFLLLLVLMVVHLNREPEAVPLPVQV